MEKIYSYEVANIHSPIIAVALHAGHYVVPQLEDMFAITSDQRLMEEDPHTDELAQLFGRRLIVNHSRFGFDLNRSPEKAVYSCPQDSWGLNVWERLPPDWYLGEIRLNHQFFYEEIRILIEQLLGRFRKLLIIDFHTYNSRRTEIDSEDLSDQPDIDISHSAKSEFWQQLIALLLEQLRSFYFAGLDLKITENYNFAWQRGAGHFRKYFDIVFGDKDILCISIEIKKRLFGNAVTGQTYPEQFRALNEMFHQVSLELDTLVLDPKCG